MPEIAFGIDLLPGGDGKAYWYMHVMSMPASIAVAVFPAMAA